MNLGVLEDMRPKDYRGDLALFLDLAPELGLSEVPDPYNFGPEAFERALDLIEHASTALVRKIASERTVATSPVADLKKKGRTRTSTPCRLQPAVPLGQFVGGEDSLRVSMISSGSLGDFDARRPHALRTRRFCISSTGGGA